MRLLNALIIAKSAIDSGSAQIKQPLAWYGTSQDGFGNSCMIRARIAEKLGWLGMSLKAAANAEHALLISTPESRVAVFVVPTNEGPMMARHIVELLSGTPRQ